MIKNIYNEDYFERGVQLGISGYTNYSWMPDLTKAMARFLTAELSLYGKTVLDYGCAKGYLVKALMQEGVDCYGFDISEYAISKAHDDVRERCYSPSQTSLERLLLDTRIETVVSKDVLEHLDEGQLYEFLKCVKDSSVKYVYIVVPLSSEDDHPYVIPAYENDITHILRKSKEWWIDKLTTHLGFKLIFCSYSHGPVKENWTGIWPKGNLFAYLTRRV